jgi:hypothetical protein
MLIPSSCTSWQTLKSCAQINHDRTRHGKARQESKSESNTKVEEPYGRRIAFGCFAALGISLVDSLQWNWNQIHAPKRMTVRKVLFSH